MIKSDFDKLIGEHEMLKRLGIFAWCAQGCMAGVSLWADQKNPDDLVQYIFEAGTAGSPEFEKVMRIMYRDDVDRKRYHIAGWAFQGKEVMPLQAADTAAYEFYKFVRNEKVECNKRPIRLSARDLFRQHEIPFFRQFDKTSFESFIKRWDGTI